MNCFGVCSIVFLKWGWLSVPPLTCHTSITELLAMALNRVVYFLFVTSEDKTW